MDDDSAAGYGMCVKEGGNSASSVLGVRCLRQPREDGNYTVVSVSPGHKVWAGDRNPGIINIGVELKILGGHERM